MELHELYLLAKICTDFDQFKTEVDNKITGQLKTVKSDNEFEIILKVIN